MKTRMKVLSILLTILMVSMSGCSNKETVTEILPVTSQPISSNNEDEEYVFVDEINEDYSEKYPMEEVDVELPFDWFESTFVFEDTQGYKYELTLKMSPWIFNSNEDILETAWNEVDGYNHILPSFNDLGMNPNGGNTYYKMLNGFDTSLAGGTRFLAYSQTDWYYSVGLIDVKNITEGFDITEDNPRSIVFPLGAYVYEPNAFTYTDDKYVNANILGRLYYSSEFSEYGGGVKLSPKMVKNTWGPVPFVLMASESFSPNTPDGAVFEYLKSSKIAVGFIHDIIDGKVIEDNFSGTIIGVVDRNGDYIVSSDEQTNEKADEVQNENNVNKD